MHNLSWQQPPWQQPVQTFGDNGMRQPQHLFGPQQQVRPEFDGQFGVPLDPYNLQGADLVPGQQQQFQAPVIQQQTQNLELELIKDALAALQIEVARKKIIVQPKL